MDGEEGERSTADGARCMLLGSSAVSPASQIPFPQQLYSVPSSAYYISVGHPWCPPLLLTESFLTRRVT